MVSNAHFDSQWNWDVQQSISVYVRNTLTQNLYLLDKYPDYVFNFEGGIKYSWMKEYYPELYARIKPYIASGRWHVSGASWDANDPNMPSPESFFRNILLGQEFYKKEFGVKSTDIFLPDCFGFGYTIPTVASHCGLIGFSTQKLQWRLKPFHGDKKYPFLFGLWQGVDGSRIAALMDGGNYGQRYDGEDLSNNANIKDIAANTVNHKGIRYYGTGDIGGSPTIASVETVQKSVREGKGPVKIVSAASDQLFKEYLPFDKHPELPVWNGELLMDVHATGCYTSQAAMKLYNRRNEVLADAAERASVAAEWVGGLDYPQAKLNEAWKRFIWHQFHDDLTGTSIPKAYTWSWNDELLCQADFANILTAATANVARGMDTEVSGTPLIVFNQLAQERKDIVVAEVPMAKKPAGVTVHSPKGKVNAQLLSYENGKAKIAFAAQAAPAGFSVYDVRSGSAAASGALKASGNTIENKIYKVTLDSNGDIASIFDKRYKRELVEKGKAVRLALFTENESFRWPAWEILKPTIDAEPSAVTGKPAITVAEKGEARVTLRVERNFDGSQFVQYISLTDGAADDRIDIYNEIDWKHTNALLKAEFPLSVANPEATYDLGIGAVRRGNNTETAYEVYAQKWADLTAPDNSYGVSVLNNSKYGWDKPADNTIRLTLLHTPKTQRGYAYQDKQDKGFHTFTYSIVGHKGSYSEAGIVRKSDELNAPMYAFNSAKHKGPRGKMFSIISSSTPQVDVKMLKKAEDGQGYVVRVYETQGKNAGNVSLTFNAPIVSAREVNGIEEELGAAQFAGNKLTFGITAFAPKTFVVRLAPVSAPQKAFACKPLEIKFNSDAFSNDAFAGTMGDFDRRGNTYAWELLPETLHSEGVDFRFGPLERANALRCNGDTIRFAPSAANKTLYLLAASSEGDTQADFTVDGKSKSYYIPYYSGFWGQWGGFEQDFSGYVKHADVAYVGTHRHNRQTGNEPYVYTYMFKIAIPVTASTDMVILPRDRKVNIFAATLSEIDPQEVTPASQMLFTSVK